MSVRLPALLAAALVVTAAGSSPACAQDAATSDRPIGAAFAGERLDYDVTFLFFRRAAVGQISLEPESAPGPDGRGGPGSGRYVARLLARTKGFVGNFRAGVYGPAEKGRRYDLDMMPVEGVRTFTLRVLEGEEERETRRKFGMGESGLVIAVKLPRAIFENEGEVFVWLSSDMVPLGAAVENYIGWGDVTGHLVRALHPAGARPVRAEDLEEARRARRRADAEETPRPLGFDRDR